MDNLIMCISWVLFAVILLTVSITSIRIYRNSARPSVPDWRWQQVVNDDEISIAAKTPSSSVNLPVNRKERKNG